MAKGKNKKNRVKSAKEIQREEEEFKHYAGTKRTAVEVEDNTIVDLQAKPKVDRDFLHQVNTSGGDLALGLIMTTSQDHEEILVWDPKTRAMHTTFKERKFYIAPNTLCTTNEYGGVVLGCNLSKTQLTCWQFTDSHKLFTVATKEPITCMKIMNQGTHIVAGSNSGTLNIWNAQSGRLLAEIKAHYEPITCICLSGDDSLILTACAGGIAKLWIAGDLLSASQSKLDHKDDKIIEYEAEPIAEYKGHNNQITGAYINKFMTRVYTSSDDKSCIIWDMFSGTQIKTFTCISAIQSMAVDAIESIVYLGCKNKNVYCFPIETVKENIPSKKPKRVLNGHRNDITIITLTKNERYLVVGTSDGVLYIWDLDEEDKFLTIEAHKDKGPITNILSITKPLCMFGLNCKLQDTVKIPFLISDDTNASLDKTLKNVEPGTKAEFLLPREKLDLRKIHNSKINMQYLPKSGESIEEEFWKSVSLESQMMIPESHVEKLAKNSASSMVKAADGKAGAGQEFNIKGHNPDDLKRIKELEAENKKFKEYMSMNFEMLS